MAPQELRLGQFKQFVHGKRTAVLGVGISNRPLIRFLHGLGARITAFDILPADDKVLSQTRADFEADGIVIDWSTGPDYLRGLTGFDLIFRTPRMRLDAPELQAEHARGAIITSEMEVFLTLCPAPVIGITGSDGKTTTSTIISEILKLAGYKVWLGGNIGTPLLDQVEKIMPEDQVVVELSSFQLMSMRQSCELALVTNISPNHLDFHTDYDEYVESKLNLFRNQSFLGRVVLNAQSDLLARCQAEVRGTVVWTNDSEAGRGDGQARTWLSQDGWLMAEGFSGSEEATQIVHRDDILIPGGFNAENFLAATATTLHLARVTPKIVAEVARSFGGVPHRLEMVREVDGVRWYNSAIDTGPGRSIATLSALAEHDARAILIMGGQDKNSDYRGLGDAVLAVSEQVILLGQNAELLRSEITSASKTSGRPITFFDVESYEEAIHLARELAKPGQVVVMTPAGTSYDRFRHFEERGKLYRDLVQALPES